MYILDNIGYISATCVGKNVNKKHQYTKQNTTNFNKHTQISFYTRWNIDIIALCHRSAGLRARVVHRASSVRKKHGLPFLLTWLMSQALANGKLCSWNQNAVLLCVHFSQRNTSKALAESDGTRSFWMVKNSCLNCRACWRTHLPAVVGGPDQTPLGLALLWLDTSSIFFCQGTSCMSCMCMNRLDAFRMPPHIQPPTCCTTTSCHPNPSLHSAQRSGSAHAGLDSPIHFVGAPGTPDIKWSSIGCWSRDISKSTWANIQLPKRFPILSITLDTWLQGRDVLPLNACWEVMCLRTVETYNSFDSVSCWVAGPFEASSALLGDAL